MTVYGSAEIQVHTKKCVKPHFSHFTARETAHGIYMRDGYSPAASLDDLEKGKISCPYSNKLRFKGHTACGLIIMTTELILAPFMDEVTI